MRGRKREIRIVTASKEKAMLRKFEGEERRRRKKNFRRLGLKYHFKVAIGK